MVFFNQCSPLQQALEKCMSASMLKFYMAAIVDGRSLCKHNLIISFLRGAQRLNSPRPYLIPSWILSVVLLGLQKEPLESLQSVKLSALPMKMALLIALHKLITWCFTSRQM